jgi:glycosyltransferase involved in cell wall biosynthesis
MKVSIFCVLEGNRSTDRYADELAAAFPAGVEMHKVWFPTRGGWWGRLIDRHLRYLWKARGCPGDLNIILSGETYAILLLALDKRRTVAVCHDLHAFMAPPGRDKLYRLRIWMNLRLLRRARAVITVSDATRGDLLRFCPFLKPEKVITVHNGLGSQWQPASDAAQSNTTRSEYGLGAEHKVVLHVANANWYKNFSAVAKAFSLLKGPGARLLKVGRLSASDEQLIHDLGIANRLIHVRQANDEELLRLYHIADVMVFPSLHEGFGWPPLEAMACGCPVVASNRPAIPEICGQACLYVDPLDARGIAAAIERVLHEPALRSQLVAAGLAQARKYQWKRTAARIAEIARP